MTKYINLILIGFCLLIPSSAGSWGVVGMSGGGASAPAGCTTANDSSQIDPTASLTYDAVSHSATPTVFLWQSFTTVGAITVTRVDAYVQDGGANGDFTVEIYSDNAGSPNAIVAVGAIGTVGNAAIQPTTPEWITFNLTTPCDLSATTVYHVVMKGVGTGASFAWGEDSTGGYSGGGAGYYSGGWGPYTGEDFMCVVWGCAI